jgi:hypothetical protein
LASSGTCQANNRYEVPQVDCETAAISLGLGDTSVYVGTDPAYYAVRPEGCIYDGGSNLRFNTLSTSLSCGADSHGCLCGALLPECDACSPGEKWASGNCEPCAAGSYTSDDGALACTPCSKGTYQPLAHQSSCLACDSGTFNDAIGSVEESDCEPCVAGFFCSTPASQVTHFSPVLLLPTLACVPLSSIVSFYYPIFYCASFLFFFPSRLPSFPPFLPQR